MKALLVAVGLVVIGAIMWAKYGDIITEKFNQKLTEVQAGFSNSLNGLTTPGRK